MIVLTNQPKTTVQNTVPSFESLLPALIARFKRALISLPQNHDPEEVLAEMVANAFIAYDSLVKRNKEVYSTPIGNYAVKHYFSGRRVTGMSAVDVCADRTKLLQRSSVFTNQDMEMYICGRTQKPSTIAIFKIDFENWINTLDSRMKQILFKILEGATTGELSKHFELSNARISGIRRELVELWKTYTADHHKEQVTVKILR